MLSSDQQKLDVGQYIVLFALDARMLGDTVYYFTQGVYTTGVVRWRSLSGGIVDYTPIDIKAEGFEVTGQGTLPRPKLSISNVSKTLLGAANTYDGLLGAHLYRYRTLKKYLVGEPKEDLNAHWPVDIYEVERKTTQNKFMIEWELKALLDNQGRKIPKRQVIRDTCEHRYRIYRGSGFVYTKATCPYADEYSPEKNITGILLANPCRVSVSSHGYKTGNMIYLSETIGGTTQLRGWFGKITYNTEHTFFLDGVDATGFTPWTSGGTAMLNPPFFDDLGRVTTDPSKDKCGKRLSDCKLRFPGNLPLPTRAFPGVAKVRM